MTGENPAHENQAHENHTLESQAQESKAQERKKPAEPSIRFTRGILKTTPGRSAGLYDTIRIDYESARRYLGKLEVTLHRTIRRPDGDPFVPPPYFELFPTYPAAHFRHSFSPEIINNGDCIVPMYQREAMWIRMHATRYFAVKISHCGRNIILGAKSEKKGNRSQDYFMPPHTPAVKGIQKFNGQYTDITASRTAIGYFLDSPVVSLRDVGDLEFEIVPRVNKLDYLVFGICDHTTEQFREYKRRPKAQIEKLFKQYCDERGVDRTSYQFFLEGELIDSFDKEGKEWTIAAVGIQEESTIEALDIIVQNRINVPGQAPCIGSMPPDLYHPFDEIALAWSDDEETAEGWDHSNTFFFKIHLLNIATFTTITELPAPLTPISKATYEDLGYSYLEIYDEPPMRQKEEHGGRRRTGRTQVAGAVAEIGTKGTRERRTFVSRNLKTKKRQSPDAVIDELIPGGEAGAQG